MTNRGLQLYFQPVVASQDPQLVLHYKVLSRLIDDQGQTIPAGRFLPWLERFGWTARLDRLMLELVLEQMAGHDESLALNLSSATLADPQMLNKVFDILRTHSNMGPRLTLEIGEEQIPEQAVLEQLTKRLRELGLIEGQVALLSSDALARLQGFGLTALVEVSLEQLAAAQVGRAAGFDPHVQQQLPGMAGQAVGTLD